MARDGDPGLLNDYTALSQCAMPEHVSPREAALAISLSDCASVLRRLPLPRGLTVAVAGTGVAGLGSCLWLKLAGARVIALGRRTEHLDRTFGAERAVVSLRQTKPVL